MFKNALLGTVALIVLTGAAVAADLGVYPKAAPLAAAPVYGGWTGLYGGFQVGYGEDWSGTTLKEGGIDFATLGNSPQGLTGGFRLGYDIQLGGPLVFGIVTEANIADFKSSNPAALMGVIGTEHTSTWWGTTNARIGLSAFGDHFLPYVFGGVAYGDAKSTVTFELVPFTARTTKVGWDAGVGIETRITKNVSIFIEGKFIDLGSVVVPVGGLETPLIASQPFKLGVIEGGLNLRF